MSSQYIFNQKAEAERIGEREKAVAAIRDEVLKLSPAELPPVEMANVIGSYDLEHFKAQGVRFFDEITRRLKLKSGSHVFDLGCGCGRMAIPFTKYLSEGHFYGCDTWPDGIEWCDRHLGGPRATFECVPAANNYYFEDLDQTKHNDFKLPWLPTGSLDAAYAISVFTHLTRADSEAYLREISRALKPDGLAYLTFFLMDRYVWHYIDTTGRHTGLREEEPGCYYAYRGQDFFGGFTMEVLSEMFRAVGLRIVSYELGDWAAKPGARNYQDTFILERLAD